jgi:hypothetical protein
VHNRGPEAAELHVLPTLWFRNTWSWGIGGRSRGEAVAGAGPTSASNAPSPPRTLGRPATWLRCDGARPLLFTENETNTARFGDGERRPYVKDGINEYLVHGKTARSTRQNGHEGAAHYRLTVPRIGTIRLRLRLRRPTLAPGAGEDPRSAPRSTRDRGARRRGRRVLRRHHARPPPPDEANVMRQALAGMLWSKQFYHYDVTSGSPSAAVDRSRGDGKGRAQRDWFHMVNDRRHLHARQVGVPLVRRVGPRLPRARPGAGGPDFAKQQLD